MGGRSTRALFHDAPEALTGFGDVPTSVKRLTPVVKELEDAIWQTMCDKWNIPSEIDPIVKEMDAAVLALEMRDLTDWEEKSPVDGRISRFRAEGLLSSVAYRAFMNAVHEAFAMRANLRAAQ